MRAQGTPSHTGFQILGQTSIAFTKTVYEHLLVDVRQTPTEAMSGADRFPWLPCPMQETPSVTGRGL